MTAPLTEAVADVRAWATNRIRHCREQETKFSNAWEHRAHIALGPPQALVEAWTERRALQAVLAMLDGDDDAGRRALAGRDAAPKKAGVK